MSRNIINDESFNGVISASPTDMSAETLRPSGATRYLAAAAYTDEKFRKNAITLDEDEFRAKAPELGINAKEVLQHCYIARRNKTLRDAALCIVVVFVCSSGIIGDLRQYPQEVSQVLDYYSGTLNLAWLLSSTITFAYLFYIHLIVLPHRFAPNTFNELKTWTTLKSKTSSNVVVYGGFSPFVGSGFDLGGWSFTVNLEQSKPSLGTSPNEFEITQLYNELRDGFTRLMITGLSIEDKLFVDGRSIRNDRRFLPDVFCPPVSNVNHAVVTSYVNAPSDNVRHYLCVEISDWSGELVLSTFVRLQKTASKLFVESSSFILPTLKKEYYDLDKHIPTGIIRKMFGLLAKASTAGPFLAIGALYTTLLTLFKLINSLFVRSQIRREIKYDPLYNYGALQSIRELGTTNSWRVYFQKLDKEMNVKIVQQQLLDVLVSFLDDHGIDTSEIKDRSSHIINNGVIVSGGTINTDSLAVGSGAQAKVDIRNSNVSKVRAFMEKRHG